ncbi:MAG: FG-GAP-like repeat-containing protein [Pseudomonadales bacterium]
MGDFNGDHYGDWAVGTPRYNISAAPPLKVVKNAGQVKIISGNSGEVLAHVECTVAGDSFGAALAGNADVNNDGFMDVVVGTPKADDPLDKKRKNVGAITVIYGCAGVDCSTSITRLGTTSKTGFGTAVALGDVDNDGKADVVVGEPKATNDQGEKPLKQAGKVTVLSGANLAAAPLLTVYGNTAGALAGSAVAAGDFNGAGGAEVVVGAPKDDRPAAFPFKPIKDTGSVRVYTNGSTTPFCTQYGVAKDAFGQALAANADINNDGRKDIAVGVPGADFGRGSVEILVGSYVIRDGICGYGGTRGSSIGNIGTAVALGDVNGDGYADIIVSSPKGDNFTDFANPIRGVGNIEVIYSDSNPLETMGVDHVFGATTKGDAFGAGLGVGDINADGKADILIGIPGKDVMVSGKTQKDAGGVEVLNATAL